MGHESELVAVVGVSFKVCGSLRWFNCRVLVPRIVQLPPGFDGVKNHGYQNAWLYLGSE